MDAFTIVDAVIAVVIVLSAILAYSRGLVRESLAIGGWVAAAILAYLFAPRVEPLMKEVPVLRDLISGSCELSMISAFAAVFALTLIVVSIFTPLFAGIVQRSALGGVDQGLGFFFGVLRGVLLVAIAFIVYDLVVVGEAVAMVDGSQSARIFANLQTRLAEMMPQDAPGWVVDRYEELLGQCEPPAQGAEPATAPAGTAPAGGAPSGT